MKAEKGKIIAVWGSPASGKSTFAVKLATAIYDNFESTVIVLFTDLETPMIPVIFPNDKPEDNGSVGIPLSKTDIEKEEIIKNLVTIKSRQNFGFIGYKDGENKFTYPRFGRAKAEELYKEVQKGVLDGAYMLPVYDQVITYAVSKDIDGFYYNPAYPNSTLYFNITHK